MSSIGTSEPHAGSSCQPHRIVQAWKKEDEEFVPPVACYPDGLWVVTGSGVGTAKVWDLESGGHVGIAMDHEERVRALAVTGDGKKIVSGSDNWIKVWDAESHALVEEWSCASSVISLAISPDDRLVAVGGFNDIRIYTMGSDGNLVTLIEFPEEDDNFMVWSMCFSLDSKKLAYGMDGDIHVYDINHGRSLLGPLRGPTKAVNCILWSRDGSRLFSAGLDTTGICVWDSKTGQQIGQWKGHTDWINALSLSPDGSILASASLDCIVQFWDVASGLPVGQPLEHREPVEYVFFSASQELVISAGTDGNIYTWRRIGAYLA